MALINFNQKIYLPSYILARQLLVGSRVSRLIHKSPLDAKGFQENIQKASVGV